MANPALTNLTDLPGVRQVGLLGAIAAAVALGATVFMWSQKPTYQPIFSQLEGKDAAEVAEALTGTGIEYKIDPVTGLITVAADRVHEARMKLAAQGLPQGGGVGFEMIRQEQGFGVSQFVESARYQHALETELVRTITNLRSVRAARVHLAIPKPTAFARERTGASASVFVELYQGRQLEAVQVASIVHLVASSIPEMPTANVTVIDQNGRLLTKPEPESDLAFTERQFGHIRRVEDTYSQRIQQLLLPMTGPGRISTQVAIDMDFTRTEETRESYRPDSTAIRSEQVTEESSRGGLANGGVPGAVANKPAGEGEMRDGQGDGRSSESTRMTRNYEMDRAISHTKQPVGKIRRLSVAVLVDHLPQADEEGEVTLQAMSEDQLARVEALVKEAVGFDAARGDTVSVMNAAFRRPEPMEIEEPAIWEQPGAQELGRQLIGALVVLLIGFAVLRPVLANLVAKPQAQFAMAGDGMLSDLSDDRASLQGESRAIAGPNNERGAVDQMPYEQKIAMAKSAVAQDPKKVAQVVRAWVETDGGN